VHQHDEKEKRQGEQTRGETRLNARHQAQRGCDKASAYEVHPKLMPWNPRRYDRRDALCHREMFGAEGRDGRRVEKRPQQNQPVESSRLLPIAANKNRDQPDCQDHPKGEI
jgi:hypothetical protein